MSNKSTSLIGLNKSFVNKNLVINKVIKKFVIFPFLVNSYEITCRLVGYSHELYRRSKKRPSIKRKRVQRFRPRKIDQNLNIAYKDQIKMSKCTRKYLNS